MLFFYLFLEVILIKKILNYVDLSIEDVYVSNEVYNYLRFMLMFKNDYLL